MGVYEDVDKNEVIKQRFDRATIALDSLKSGYSSALAKYDSALHDKELFGEKLLGEIETAIEEKQFKVFYQPKYDVSDEKPRLCGAEALVRWLHPEHGMVSPGVFIPLFEKNALVQKLDRYVWKEAASQVKLWKDKFGYCVPVSVNVSRIDIFESDIESFLVNLIKESGLSTENIHLEITESAYTDDSSQLIKTVETLRADGFKIEMDDFGTGYSSLNMLTKLPIDILKLDMAFIRHMTENPGDRKMVKLVVDIADFLAVPTIAEGVESEDQLTILKDYGCKIIQGYYFSKPVPADEFEKFIKNDNCR